MFVRWLGLVAASVSLVACGPTAFGCSSADQCQADGVAGTCEPTGFCSFPDPSCPSGRRYGDLAGEGNAGVCATDPAGTGTTSSSGTSGTGTGSGTTSSTTTTSPATSGLSTDGSSTQAEAEAEVSTAGPQETCDDGRLGGDESDVDCGGACPGCNIGQACNVPDDCFSGLCVGGVCTARDVADNCIDGVQNRDEEGVDCGGSCEPCGVPCRSEPARWNPADAQTNIEFLEDARAVTVTENSVNDSVRADTAIDDRHYWEVELVTGGSIWVRIGTADVTLSLEVGPNGSNGFGLGTQGDVPGVGESGLAVAEGDIVGVAVDVAQQRAWVHVNGAWGFAGGPTQSEGEVFGYDVSTPLYPVLTLGQGDLLRANFGNEPFAYTIPPGFVGGVCD